MNAYALDGIRLLVVLLLVGLNAFFVAAEFALVTVRRTRVEELAGKGRFGARALREAVQDLDRALAATQVGITIASLALGWLGEPAMAHLLRPLFGAIPGPWGLAVTHAAAITVALLAITYLHVVLGEQVPKVMAIQRAEDVALLAAGPLLAFGRVASPLLAVIGGSSRWVLRRMRLRPLAPSRLAHSVDELRMLLEETRRAGVIAEDQASYVHNVFRLSGKRARDVMLPREKVVTLSLNASEEQVLATARESAHTRMPVWEGDPDNIVGIVNTKNLFHLFSLRGLVILMDAMYPPIFADPEEPIARLLQTFRRERRPMAVVRDAGGHFLGIVTLEDILEEIVGEIEDEHDAPRPGGPSASHDPAAAAR